MIESKATERQCGYLDNTKLTTTSMLDLKHKANINTISTSGYLDNTLLNYYLAGDLQSRFVIFS